MSSVVAVVPYAWQRFEKIKRKENEKDLRTVAWLMRANQQVIIGIIHDLYLKAAIDKERIFVVTPKNVKSVVKKDSRPIQTPLMLFQAINALKPSLKRDRLLAHLVEFMTNPSHLLSFIVRYQLNVTEMASLFFNSDFKLCANFYSTEEESLESFYLVAWIVLQVFQKQERVPSDFRKLVADALEEHPQAAVTALKITSERYCKKVSVPQNSMKRRERQLLLNEWQKDFFHHYSAIRLCFCHEVPYAEFDDFFFETFTLDKESSDTIKDHMYGNPYRVDISKIYEVVAEESKEEIPPNINLVD